MQFHWIAPIILIPMASKYLNCLSYRNNSLINPDCSYNINLNEIYIKLSFYYIQKSKTLNGVA